MDRVLKSIVKCSGRNARIIPVLDGCTDGSEEIVRQFAKSNDIDTQVVVAPDVHEIKSINMGLREANPGYCVIIQDDVILQDALLEEKVRNLCKEHLHKLGYISFRLAADVSHTGFLKRLRLVPKWGSTALSPMVNDFNLIGHPQEELHVPRGAYGGFYPRMVGIKSPVCLTPELREYEPFLDEDFAPYCYDDVDLSLRALKRGLINGLFPIRFESQLEWGGTRKDPSFSSKKGASIFLRNRRLIWKKHGEFIRNYGFQQRLAGK